MFHDPPASRVPLSLDLAQRCRSLFKLLNYLSNSKRPASGGNSHL